ncbi:MAG: tRNA preQ1(34) S-adenosylmethionine ribosyltransferase-isomerase QueA [Deferribacteraceae bacterium]|jgi:S-adenosylmethionine:tRNA ribosyltransferase-isomerase|nr:tRNA preQ1(34) S-adenosylmethionine ribosyltransferase-isomerase QueA [Deferribacteraceae bacterium]
MYDDTASYDYFLPDELVAQYPAEKRDGARLLVAGRSTGLLYNCYFPDILTLLDKRNFLVINDSRVLPARLPVTKITGGRSEVFYLRGADAQSFYALVKGKHRQGSKLWVTDNIFVRLKKRADDGGWLVSSNINVKELLKNYGKTPLPPYILRPAENIDKQRYQTVYAEYDGSIAAPTAGLHFTEEILNILDMNKIPVVKITLHVGAGTFRPVKTAKLSDHDMHSEIYCINAAAAERINRYKSEGRKLIAVGTTAVRALESASDETGIVCTGEFETKLFIKPGYRFKAVDGMITNLHLPKSTLLVLVSAFMGYENAKKAYSYAVKEKYRFFSYGDAMLIKD